MGTVIFIIAGIAVALVVGLLIGKSLGSKAKSNIEEDAKNRADELLESAKKKSESIIQDAKIKSGEEKVRMLAELEKESQQLKKETKELERRIRTQNENQTKKTELMAAKEIENSKREAEIERTERSLAERKRNLDKKIVEVGQTIEKKAGLSREDAKKELVESITDDAKRQAAIKIREIEEEAKEEAESRAKRIIGLAIQRYAGEHIQERAVSVIHLPTDELKGRIIGREGRNIRALEAATGIDLIVDDTPETVVISGFDPVRREVARLSLDRLIQDGRIHPSRIEEIVSKAREDVNKAVKDAGEQAILELGLARVHPEIVKMLGRLKFRYSYAQNVLRHSVECGFIAGMMAAELGLNQRKARRAGLLHDLGKAMTHEIEGSHAVIGAQFAKKYKEEPLVVNAIAAHHEDETPTSIIAHLVAAADALSGARPGARREMLESYVQRLENLEQICKSFKGVTESYAIQAGREVRVMVENETITDNDAIMLSKDIAARIENELTYPGQIQVTVIRESRAIATAK
ncbi:MAG: ribonuclease Y [Deltaproteobacteria bacterium]|nr:ribonuclease Y [Deltaproteobacteria bacterium]